MTYQEFKNKWFGKRIDFDSAYGAQCVDVYRQYCKEFGIPQSLPVAGAKDIWDSFLPDYFDRILNTPEAVPQQGDIVIWGMKPYGHVAIYDNGSVTKFQTIGQNWKEGDGSGVLTLENHDYSNVLGWLRMKPQAPDFKWLASMYLEQGIDLSKGEGEVRARVQEIFDGWKKYGEMEKRLQRAEKELAGAKAEAADFEQRLITSEGTIRRLNKETDDLRASVASRDVEISSLKQRIETLEAQLDPDKVIVITRDEYARLTAKKTLDRFTNWELIQEFMRRVVRKND